MSIVPAPARPLKGALLALALLGATIAVAPTADALAVDVTSAPDVGIDVSTGTTTVLVDAGYTTFPFSGVSAASEPAGARLRAGAPYDLTFHGIAANGTGYGAANGSTMTMIVLDDGTTPPNWTAPSANLFQVGGARATVYGGIVFSTTGVYRLQTWSGHTIARFVVEPKDDIDLVQVTSFSWSPSQDSMMMFIAVRHGQQLGGAGLASSTPDLIPPGATTGPDGSYLLSVPQATGVGTHAVTVWTGGNATTMPQSLSSQTFTIAPVALAAHLVAVNTTPGGNETVTWIPRLADAPVLVPAPSVPYAGLGVHIDLPGGVRILADVPASSVPADLDLLPYVQCTLPAVPGDVPGHCASKATPDPTPLVLAVDAETGAVSYRPPVWSEESATIRTGLEAAGGPGTPPEYLASFLVPDPDLLPPLIDMPWERVVDATAPSGAAVGYSVSAYDARDGPVPVACSPPSGSIFPIGNTTVTCTAQDAAGNVANGSFVVRVRDGAPTIAPHDTVWAEATSASGAIVTYEPPATSDAVDGPGVATCTPTSGALFARVSTNVTCIATDSAGNAATPTRFSVVVVDSTPPALHLPSVVEEATGPGGASLAYLASATDLVDGPVPIHCAPASGSTFPLGTTVVSCWARDAGWNNATGTFPVLVRDTTAPLIAPPEDVAVGASTPEGTTVTYGAPETSDAVDGPGLATCAPASGSVFALGTTRVTCTATDAAGNAATPVGFDLVVSDAGAPMLAIPAFLDVEAAGPDGAVVEYGVDAHDAVDGAVPVACAPASGSRFPIGTTIVSCSVSDSAGNAASAAFPVHVRDTTPPALLLPQAIAVEATGAAGAAVPFDASATDLVDGAVTVDCSRASGSVFPLGSTDVVCTASDAAGNAASASFVVLVRDTTPPAIASAPDVLAEATGPDGATVAFAAPATSDLVDGSGAATCAPASGGRFALGSTSVQCSATDAAGNAAAPASFTITVRDTTAPQISAGVDVVAEALYPDGADVTYDAPLASDTVSGSWAATCAPSSGGRFALGSTEVRCEAIDAAGNAASPTTFHVVVRDTTAPTLVVADVVAEATGSDGATVSYDAPVASDAVSSSIAPSCAPASGSRFALGATTVECTATDDAGNVGRATFVVSVRDTTPPAFLPFAAPAPFEATSRDGAVVDYAAPVARDLVDGDIVATCAPASGARLPLGRSQVDCAVVDAAGNRADVYFGIDVVDTTAPVIDPAPDVAAVIGNPVAGAVTYAIPQARDAVDGASEATCSPASGSLFAPGLTAVTCTATDLSGNAAAPVSFRVNVSVLAHMDLAVDPQGNVSLDGRTVRATLRSDDGTPIANATVRIASERVGPLFPMTFPDVVGTTDANGTLAFRTSLRYEVPGEYRFVATSAAPYAATATATSRSGP